MAARHATFFVVAVVVGLLAGRALAPASCINSPLYDNFDAPSEYTVSVPAGPNDW